MVMREGQPLATKRTDLPTPVLTQPREAGRFSSPRSDLLPHSLGEELRVQPGLLLPPGID